MSIAQLIETKLQPLAPHYLAVHNESYKHRVPPGSESHFKVVVVSGQFEGQRLLARHRLVNQLLAAELAGPVHALALHTYTLSEWQQNQEQFPPSPACHGGSNPP